MNNELIVIFFDLETTGLNPDIDEIIEIGAIKVQGDKIIEQLHTLVRPDKSIPKFITDLTGIGNKDVEKAPRAEEIKDDIEKFIGNYPLVAHNANFDKAFLQKLLGSEILNEVFDSLELSRLFLPELYSHSLQNLVRRLNLKSEGPHRALADTLMLYAVFKKIEDERKKFPRQILHKFKEILIKTHNFESIFGENWEDTENQESSLNWEVKEIKTTKTTLPFREAPTVKVRFSDGAYFIESDINNEMLEEISELAKSKKLLLLTHSENVAEKVSNYFIEKTLSVTLLNNYERFICPKKIQFFLDNPDLLAQELKIHFAILVSYVFKTRDFFIDRAPTHILKNPILRILSSCEENPASCEYKSFCPLKLKIDEISVSDIVISEFSLLYSDNCLKESLKQRALVMLEAFRIPKSFYSYRMDFSFLDLKTLMIYYNFSPDKILRVQETYNTISRYPNGEDVSKEMKVVKEVLIGCNNDLMRRFLQKNVFQKGFRNGSTTITAVDRDIQKTFKENSINFNPLLFVSKYTRIGEKEILSDFTGLEGKFVEDKYPFDSKILVSVVPLFSHSPNHDEFTVEFVKFFKKIHAGVKTAIILQQQTLMKEIYFALKNDGLSVKAYGTDTPEEKKEIDFFMYDVFPTESYKEVYFIKLPAIQNNNSYSETEYYSALLIKNLTYEIIDKIGGRPTVFYFDGKLKNKDYRIRFEDMFISFPLYLEREESLLRIIEKIRNNN
jgi:DNA polymerase III epsilon subunit family exonuclease